MVFYCTNLCFVCNGLRENIGFQHFIFIPYLKLQIRIEWGKKEKRLS